MIINYYKMTGDELKRIYKVSGMRSEEFAKELGLERHQLYTQFSRMSKPVDSEVEADLKKNPLLAPLQQNLAVGQKSEPTKVAEEQDIYGPSGRLFEKVVEMLNETIRLVSDDNKFIKQDAEVFRNIVDQWVKSGTLAPGKAKKV